MIDTPTQRRIAKLNDQLANQIAAGEVVERPGAAMKELIENSLDAGARTIRVHVHGGAHSGARGGASLLEVADDGSGIHHDDMLLALDRHATSKIHKPEDLFAIQTWGFRGEALASIAAVSRLTLSSRAAASTTNTTTSTTTGRGTGREIICEGGLIKEDRAVARAVGTTVKVEDLFFNTPARKKFLKSPGAESTFIAQTFHRLAISAPETSFELTSEGERLFLYPPATSMAARIADVYRSAWKLHLDETDLLHVDAVSAPYRLRAWILPSKHFIPSSRGILLYVNKRSVKDKLLQQAVLTAAKEALFGNLYPQLVLSLETPPEGVDVNVHPTKAELRFRDSGHVFAFVRKHLEKALAGDRRGSVGLSSGFSLATTTEPLFPNSLQTGTHYHQKLSYTPPTHTPPTHTPQEHTSLEHTSFEQAPLQTHTAPTQQPGPQLGPQTPQFLGTLKNTYLLCQDDQGLVLVDQHAAHERVTYEKLKNSRLSKLEAQPLLIPLQIELGREALDRLESEFPRFAEQGLVLDRSGPTLLTVREIPSLLLKKDGAPVLSIGNFLRKLAQDWDESTVEGELAEAFRNRLLDVLASESCHGSVRAGQTLSSLEAMSLLAQMSETDFSGHCPHGRPTTVRLRWQDLERLFKRVF